MAKKKSKKKPKQYNNYYGQSAAAKDINSWTNYLDRYEGKNEWAKKWMHDDSNIHFGNYVRDNESVWEKWKKSGKTDNKDLWAFGQADWEAGGNLKDRYVAKILKGKNPGDLNKTGSAYDDMGVVSVFKSARWGYDQKAQDKLRASWGKDYWGRKGYNKGHSVHWYDPKDKTNRYGVTEGVLGGGQAPKDLMHVNPNYLPVKEDKPKTEVADVNNGTSPPPPSPGAGGNSGRPRPANNGSFFNNLLTRYGNKQGLRDRKGSIEDAGSLLDKYTYNDRSKGYQGKGDGHQSSSMKRLPKGANPRSEPRWVDHLGNPISYVGKPTPKKPTPKGPKGGGSYKPRWLDYVGKPTRGPKDINGGPRHPKGPKGVNSYKPGWFDHVGKPPSRSNWVNNETGEVWKPDPSRSRWGDPPPGKRHGPGDGAYVDWAEDPRLQQWTETAPSTGKPTGGPRHPKGPKGGFYDKPGWLSDIIGKPPSRSNWVNNETGEVWKPTPGRRGDFEPGYKPAPNDGPMEWAEDPRLQQWTNTLAGKPSRQDRATGRYNNRHHLRDLDLTNPKGGIGPDRILQLINGGPRSTNEGGIGPDRILQLINGGPRSTNGGPKSINGGPRLINGGHDGKGGPRDGGSEWKHELTGPGVTGYHPHPKGPKGGGRYKPGWSGHVGKPPSRSNWVNNETGEVWKPDPKRKVDFEPGYRPAPDDGREVWADDPRLQQWTRTPTGKPTGGPKDINGGHDGKGGPKATGWPTRRPKGPKRGGKGDTYEGRGWANYWQQSIPKRDDSKWSDDFFNQAVRMGAESQVIDREKLTERIDARSRGHMDEADYLGYLSRGQVRGENRPKWGRPGGIGSTYEPNTDIKPWLDGIYDIGGK